MRFDVTFPDKSSSDASALEEYQTIIPYFVDNGAIICPLWGKEHRGGYQQT